MIWLQLLLLTGFSFLLIKATDIVSESLQQLSRLTRIGKFAMTSFLLTLATSAPELVVGVAAALEGTPNLALGTVVGSNIANVSLVIGLAAVIGGSFSVVGEFLKVDIFSVFLAGVMPLMLLLDGRLSRVDGLILLLVYGAYNFGLLNKYNTSPPTRGWRLLSRMFNGNNRGKMSRWLAWLFLGGAMLVFAADMIVNVGAELATGLGVPVFLIGLFFVAIGTSLPELAFQSRAVRKGQVAMALGNLMGSVVANSTLILGIVSLIRPVVLYKGLNAYLLAAAAFGVIFMLFWYLVKTKKKLERWEGAVLLLAYAVFMWLEWLGK